MIELSKQELKASYWYILNNCDEIAEYKMEPEDLLKAESLDNVDQRHKEEFSNWFRKGVTSLYDEGLLNEEMYVLAKSPDRRSVQYPGCIANDIRWSVKQMERYRTTQDSGVTTLGRTWINLAPFMWYNSHPEKLKFNYHLTSLNVNTRWYDDDPYVLASQTQKVFYLDDPKLGHPWRVVQQIQYRHVFDVPENEEDEMEDDIDSDSNGNDINNEWEDPNDDDDESTDDDLMEES
ncbi:hypothetical protein M0R45_035934 [Rubus argutus]|uniref:DUF4216 domain-containing protein n=1 Tax=Rubus argutus TaxID=59490 RepID=A0AAW1VX55_RUBAR